MADDATAFWEARYAGSEQIWSGRPNQALVDVVTDLAPGTALDLGCGEGGDSLWLAAQGWQVTAVDISATAIARARTRVAEHDIPKRQVSWVVADLASWQPTEHYTLVSACFLHSPVDFPRADVLRRAAAGVDPGGHLLIVAHAEPPPWAEDHAAHHHLVDPSQEIADLQLSSAWDITISDTRPRDATGPHGEHATLCDSVVLLHRR